MFKKFITIATATLLFATGLGIVATPSALATSDCTLDSSSTIKGKTFPQGTPRSDFNDFFGNVTGVSRGSVSLTTLEATGSATSVLTSTNGTATWKYFAPGAEANITSLGTDNHGTTQMSQFGQIVIQVSGGGCITKYLIIFSILRDHSPAPSTPTLTAAEIAAAATAAAKAVAAAAAAVRAAEVSAAQTKLSTVLKGDKAGTIDEYKSANVNITTAASLARINAEVLKLSVNDRSDFAKIKAIADKIEFDESFFNATARPSLATYSSYGVTGVTERILPVINAKVLELPAALRADVKAMQELVKVESFVDRVANPATRSTVSAVALIERGLFPANSIYKFSVVRGLGSYPEGSLNTVAKIEAAVKEQIFKAEAPKRRLAEIKARIAARNK